MVTDESAVHRLSGPVGNSILDHELSDMALVEALLSHVMMAGDAERVARDLLSHSGGIRGLLTISPEQVCTPTDLVATAAACIQTAVQVVLRAQCASFHQGVTLTGPDAAEEFLVARLGHQERELFACILMDSQHRVIDYRELFHGTIDGAEVHIREIVRHALRRNAAALMLVHNHPSGATAPSGSDIRLTRRASDALAHVEVRVLDHLVVAGDTVVSLARLGHL